VLQISGAWLCGLSSVPQGSGLARLRSSTGCVSFYLVAVTDNRGGIDKNLRKIICPKINFDVWKL
jgi:hypothetical protein